MQVKFFKKEGGEGVFLLAALSALFRQNLIARGVFCHIAVERQIFEAVGL